MAGFLAVASLLVLCTTPVRADWWGAVSGALDEAKQAGAAAADEAQMAADRAQQVGATVADSSIVHSAVGMASEAQQVSLAAADSDIAHQLRGSGTYLLTTAQNATTHMIERAKIAACDMRVEQNIVEVNRTMYNQLNSDCETTASKIPFLHDQVYDTCESMGSWNINRTLEAQRTEQKAECLQALDKMPEDLTNALNIWGNRSKNTLSQQLQSTIQGTIAKVQETQQTDDKVQETQQTDDKGDLMVKSSALDPATPSAAVLDAEPLPQAVIGSYVKFVVGSVPFLVVGGIVWARRPRSSDSLLPLDQQPLVNQQLTPPRN